MNKTLHPTFSSKTITQNVKKPQSHFESKNLRVLMQEMKGILQDASTDLLQPRPEAVAELLRKAALR
ncbi:MAG: hypothetical protein WCG87_01640 [Bacteroidota bacterium]